MAWDDRFQPPSGPEEARDAAFERFLEDGSWRTRLLEVAEEAEGEWTYAVDLLESLDLNEELDDKYGFTLDDAVQACRLEAIGIVGKLITIVRKSGISMEQLEGFDFSDLRRRNNIDLHRAMAAYRFGVDYDDVTEEKALQFLELYSSKEATLPVRRSAELDPIPVAYGATPKTKGLIELYSKPNPDMLRLELDVLYGQFHKRSCLCTGCRRAKINGWDGVRGWIRRMLGRKK